MSGGDTGRTFLFAPFAGRRRRFQVRLGEVEELERLAGAGIGEIMLRLAQHRFRAADIRETVRLGLMGGGLDEAEATVLAMTYVDDKPLGGHLQLAADILSAAISGVPADGGEGNETGEGDSPATSPPSSQPEPPSDDRPTTSAA